MMAPTVVTRRQGGLQKIESPDLSPLSGSASSLTSPKMSPSSTSLSSLDSDLAHDASQVNSKQSNRMIDTNGNAFEIPDFTIKQIRDAIPAHCYQRSAARSLGYVARDVALLATVFYLFNTYCTPEYVPFAGARAVLWGLYTVIQGIQATGVWVLAHECGHGGFSDHRLLNDIVGWICHSALLVPYFSWKISHGKHHKATAHLQRDMVFVPRSRAQYARGIGRYAHELVELAEETPIVTAGLLLGQQLVGWPVYLFTNATGHDYHERQVEGRGKGKKNGYWSGVNHFNPESPLYEAKDAKYILLSDIGLAIASAGLFLLTQKFGFANMLVWYFIPYLWVNHWLVAITYLQHTDPSLPHYQPESWSFTRGAAATVDRDFGFVGRHMFHGIIETHVLHHFVSNIPFYNADEATEAIKPVMGQHYKSDTKDGPLGFLRSLWRSHRMCNWIEPTEGAEGEAKTVLFFRNRNGLGMAPAQKSD